MAKALRFSIPAPAAPSRPFSLSKGFQATPPKVDTKRGHELEGKTVFFKDEDGTTVAGVVKSVLDQSAVIALALPNPDGILLVTDSNIVVPAASLEEFKGITQEAKIKRWELSQPFDLDEKAFSEVKEGNVIVDYRDVFVEGLASTFKNVTPADRDGDFVEPNAFNDTITSFMKNPVMLYDHRNSVDNIAGSFDKLGISPSGLVVRGRVSNAPELRKLRFLLAEKHLRAFSIGGLFMFGGENGHAIQKVQLFEISLVAIPANQDALFTTRSLSLEDVKTAYKCMKREGTLTFQKAA